MAILFANNAFGTLATSINTTTTSISLQSGQGARFPSPMGGDIFYATLVNQANELEIVKCTGRVNDTLTVQRAQEGTPARSFVAGDRVELRLTAAGLTDFVQLSTNNTLTGVNTFTQQVNAVDFNSTSDARLKTNIKGIEDALKKVMLLKGVSFDWADSGDKTIGLIAQDVEQVLPDVVSQGEVYKSVAYGNIVAVLIEAIKEQQKQIDLLKSLVGGNENGN